MELVRQCAAQPPRLMDSLGRADQISIFLLNAYQPDFGLLPDSGDKSTVALQALVPVC